MERAKRRLAAIMCADVAHYSRLMEQDEDGTLSRLKTYRTIMSSLTSRHNGRIVNTWGDSVIVEFTSVIEAVQCAVDIQNELSHKNAELPDSTKMEFRIGLNLGDIMIEGDDIYGDGVNVAARLQELAPKGGIMLSQSVYDQVRSKLALGFDPLGPKQVKNVTEPVETYSVRLGGRNDPEAVSQPEPTGATWQADPSPQGQPEWEHGTAVSGFERARRWVQAQPKKIRTCVYLIGFFFVLNLLTSGLSTLWFLWPSFPFIIMLAWHLVVGGKDQDIPSGRSRPE
jgi:adenylate cyclase